MAYVAIALLLWLYARYFALAVESLHWEGYMTMTYAWVVKYKAGYTRMLNAWVGGSKAGYASMTYT